MALSLYHPMGSLVGWLSVAQAALLRQECNIHTWEDLLSFYPLRYEDRRKLHTVSTLPPHASYVQLRGTLKYVELVKTGKKRLVADLEDTTGTIRLLWFQGLSWVHKKLKKDEVYTVFGRLTTYAHQRSLIHPELTFFKPETSTKAQEQRMVPIYSTTAKMLAGHLHSKRLARLQGHILQTLTSSQVETLPPTLLRRYQLVDKLNALQEIHFPYDFSSLGRARLRLKFEEFFYLQLQFLRRSYAHEAPRKSRILQGTKLLHRFYTDHLPFSLTKAQKKVVREIYRDLKSGWQMNRLLQGDVGSGKTVVALLSMLICVGSGAQAALMAPTELLAMQHYRTLQTLVGPMPVTMALLTGSTSSRVRKEVLHALQKGDIHIVVGTHALLNKDLTFSQLGLVVIDEQHKFGVAQRAMLREKDTSCAPHVLVMTATPIPRTLAMTFYGDMHVSILHEMPAGRKPVKTLHYYDTQRLALFGFLRRQMQAQQQVYVVYPLIEESEKLAYKNLIEGYESIRRAFPEFSVSVVHGQMNASDKAHEMSRFEQGMTQLMVATTVIEVGVDVPKATVMVIENAERFGLAQLHQLRGRVGRGSEQAYCILMTGHKMSAKGKKRIHTMVRTHDGFEIADVDLQLRGPGDFLGVKQSGLLELKIADLTTDKEILAAASEAVHRVLKEDPTLTQAHHLPIKKELDRLDRKHVHWSKVI